MSEFVDLILKPRWIVPVAPSGVVLEDHVVAIHEGRIHALLPEAEARARLEAGSWLDLPDEVVLPGLINTHTHAAMALLRGYADDLPLMTWLEDHIWPAERAVVSAEFVADGTELACAEMLLGGTTCFADMYFFPDAVAAAAIRAGIRAVVGLIVIDFPSAWARDADEYLSKGLRLHNDLLEQPLIETMLAPHAPYTVGDRALERIRILADEIGRPVHMHVHETAGEVAMAREQTGERPLARLRRLGLLNSQLIATHMTQLTDDELELVAAQGVHIAHCPESNLKLASGFCPVARLQAAGVNVALGTDGAASNNDLDMFGELRTAALLAKGVAGDASAVPAATALSMATLHGARALGIDEQTGSLEPGKAADLISVRLARPGALPVYDIISHLVYATQRDQVRNVWVAGRQVVREQQLLTIDEEELMRSTRRWQRKLGKGA